MVSFLPAARLVSKIPVMYMRLRLTDIALVVVNA